jgi:hypothetical protein
VQLAKQNFALWLIQPVKVRPFAHLVEEKKYSSKMMVIRTVIFYSLNEKENI